MDSCCLVHVVHSEQAEQRALLKLTSASRFGETVRCWEEPGVACR